MKVVITEEQSFITLDHKKIRDALKLLPELEKFRLSLVYVDDAQIAVLNERYLKHQGATDVLSFSYGAKEGEIIVSAETALREATERKIDPFGEILLYTIHGALHLLGYDDHNDDEYQIMHEKEQQLLEKLGYKWSWDSE